MGTLFEQLPRMERLTTLRIIELGQEIKEIKKELNISFDEALNLYLAAAKIDDYDVKDEQLQGFGEILKEIKDILQDAVLKSFIDEIVDDFT